MKWKAMKFVILANEGHIVDFETGPGIQTRFGLIRYFPDPEKGNRRLIYSRKGAFF